MSRTTVFTRSSGSGCFFEVQFSVTVRERQQENLLPVLPVGELKRPHDLQL